MSASRVAVLLSVVLAGAAVAFGSVEPWAQEWLLFAAAALFFLSLLRKPDAASSASRAPTAALLLPAVALLVWAGLQALPLGAGIVRSLAPRTAALFARTVPAGGGESLPSWLLARARAQGAVVEAGAIPQGTPDAGDRSVGRALSIHPAATRGAILTWLTPLLVFLTAAAVARDATARYRLLWGISLTTGLIGLLGLVQMLYWNEKLLWFRPTPPEAMPFGPFVNPNHYAGFVEMGTLSTLGLIMAVIARAGQGLSPAALRAASTDREWAQPRLAVLGLCALLGAAGLAGSGSRGGWIACGAGLLALLALRGFRGFIPLVIALIVLSGVGVGAVAALRAGERSMSATPLQETGVDPSFDERLDTYARTFRLILDNPVGTGLGTFPSAFAAYQRQGEWQNVAQAHNDYLQLMAETGWVGIVLLVWALAVFLRRLVRPILRTRARPTTAGVLIAVVAMLVHSLIEFNLQIPAVHALFAALLGILAAAAVDPAPRAEEGA